MSGTVKCAWCSSTDTQAGFTMVQCLSCGQFTTYDGSKTVATSEANEGIEVADLPEPESISEESTPDGYVEPVAELEADVTAQVSTETGEESGTDEADEDPEGVA